MHLLRLRMQMKHSVLPWTGFPNRQSNILNSTVMYGCAMEKHHVAKSLWGHMRPNDQLFDSNQAPKNPNALEAQLRRSHKRVQTKVGSGLRFWPASISAKLCTN